MQTKTIEADRRSERLKRRRDAGRRGGIAAGVLWGVLMALGSGESARGAEPDRYFAIEVVDDRTGRGVPMVELMLTNGATFYTDSHGLVAFEEPGVMDQRVFFYVSAHGYEFAPDGFGIRGVALPVKAGGKAQIKIKRINIAERIYRITGQGIYRDTVRLGRKAPIAEPLLNAEVTGQDSTLTAIYRGKTYWFYGDTNRLAYALGNFSMTGATTGPPEALEPEVGLNLKYFTGKNGFARAMAPMTGEGVVWLSGVVVLPDEAGKERLLAYFQRRKGLGAILENGFVEYNDAQEIFEKAKVAPNDPSYFPHGQAFRAQGRDGITYAYFPGPYPALRVKANRGDYLDLTHYEGYTCLEPGASFQGKGKTRVERDAQGRVVWGWKAGTPPLEPKEQEALIAAGELTAEESPLRLRDAESGKFVLLNGCSCAWNAYRNRYVMIASQALGATVLGEVWYSEADSPEGPWKSARKIITHANKKGDAHDFYNPVHHPFLDREGGRVIYLEGSYVNTFSGNPHQTPYYEYNQIMYRLDLSDPALKLPEEGKGSP